MLYADGQKIAKKLSVQISKETSSLKSLLRDYNACNAVGGDTSYEAITISVALDSSVIEEKLRAFGSWNTAVATGEKRLIIDSYLRLCRSREELSMLKEEVANLVACYEEKKKSIAERVDQLSNSNDPYEKGAVAMLNCLLTHNDVLLKESYTVKELLVNSAAGGDLSTAQLDQGNDDSDAYDSDNSDCGDFDDD